MATAGATLPSADRLPVSRRANIPYRLVRLIGVALLRLGFRFDVQGGENIPRSANYVVLAHPLNRGVWPRAITDQGHETHGARAGRSAWSLCRTIQALSGQPLRGGRSRARAPTALAFRQMRQMLQACVGPAGRKRLCKQRTHLS